MNPKNRWIVLASITLLVVTATAACGDENGGDNTAPTASNASAEIKALLTGNYEPPPADSPKPEPGKEIWLISCGQSIETCKVANAGAQEAAESMGWEVRLFDTKGDVGLANTAIRQALAAKADGIFTWYIDCSAMRAGLEEAKAAGVPVVGAEVYDCNEDGRGGPQLFAHTVDYVQGSYDNWILAWGAASATYLLNKVGEEGTIIVFGDDVGIGSRRAADGFASVVDKCADCELVRKDFTFTELTAGVQQQVEQELLRHPDVTGTGVTYDGVFLAGVSSGVLAADRDIVTMGGEGSPATMDLVRQGKAAGGVGIPVAWEGYAGIDALNRLLEGEKPVSSGIGVQVFDQQHNTPESGPYQGPYDYKQLYQEAWGVD